MHLWEIFFPSFDLLLQQSLNTHNCNCSFVIQTCWLLVVTNAWKCVRFRFLLCAVELAISIYQRNICWPIEIEHFALQFFFPSISTWALMKYFIQLKQIIYMPFKCWMTLPSFKLLTAKLPADKCNLPFKPWEPKYW